MLAGRPDDETLLFTSDVDSVHRDCRARQPLQARSADQIGGNKPDREWVDELHRLPTDDMGDLDVFVMCPEFQDSHAGDLRIDKPVGGDAPATVEPAFIHLVTTSGASRENLDDQDRQPI